MPFTYMRRADRLTSCVLRACQVKPKFERDKYLNAVSTFQHSSSFKSQATLK